MMLFTLKTLTHYLIYTLLILLTEFIATSLFKGKNVLSIHYSHFMFVPFSEVWWYLAASPILMEKNLTRKDPLYLMWINSFYEEYLHQLKKINPQLQNISVNILNENSKG